MVVSVFNMDAINIQSVCVNVTAVSVEAISIQSVCVNVTTVSVEAINIQSVCVNVTACISFINESGKIVLYLLFTHGQYIGSWRQV